MARSRFTAEKVADAKRLVRGEHWLAARAALRRRDRVHHRPWRVLTLAGGNPSEEIDCIRSIMPKARVFAADVDPVAIERAIDAGADDVFLGEIDEFRKLRHGGSGEEAFPPGIAALAPFDVVNLDFCGSVDANAECMRRYSTAVGKWKGVLMVTFSYGRDVCELYETGPFGPVPAPLAGRVRACAEAASSQLHIKSVLAYPGNRMPMCAVIWERGDKWVREKTGAGYKEIKHLREPASFERVADGDLFAACVMADSIDPSMMYAVPSERIRHFRRKLAAQKAAATRKSRQRPPDPAPQSPLARELWGTASMESAE